MQKQVFLSLGSNIGDRAAHISRALVALDAAGVRIVRRSSLYRTEPMDAPPQQWFLNCAAEAQTQLLPGQLLRTVRRVEHALGRRRAVARGPRTVDIDILLYGYATIRTRDLDVPHPRLAERRFVLAPLAEIAPSLRHPALRRTIAELLACTVDGSNVARWHAPSD